MAGSIRLAGRRRFRVVRGRRSVALAAAAVLALSLSGCGGESATTSAPGQTRTVLVDYNHDEAALSAFAYFPRRVEVRPGDTVEFKQSWTGEPHSVTLGSYVSEELEPLVKLFENVEETGKLPNEEPKEFAEFDLPYALGGEDDVNQNAARPCFVEDAAFTGAFPGDATTPCPETEQPEFSGQPIYSSGIIPFEGVDGNTFTVKLSEDLEPGTYTYYCNVHGALQWGAIEVKEKGAEIPSASAVAKQARAEANDWSDPFIRRHRDAVAGRKVEGGEPESPMSVVAKGKNLVGVPTPFFEDNAFRFGVLNEFVPRNTTGKVGEPVTWTFISGHTLSFNVPKYFPVFTVADDGKVSMNPKITPPIIFPSPPDRSEGPGGGDAESEGGGDPEGGGEGGGDSGGDEGGEGGPPPEPNRLAIEWDGKGFASTGMGYGDLDTLSITFTKAGTYPFACLIHPQMVGKVTITS